MNKRIIGLCGFARVGKDSFADMACELFREKGITACKMSIAEELKNDLEKAN